MSWDLPLLHVLSGEEEGGEVVCPAAEEFKFNFNFNLILIPIDRSFPQNLMQMLMTMSDDEPEVGEHDQSEDVDKVQSLPEYCHRHHYYRCNRHHDFNRHHLLDHHLQNCNHRHQ